MNTSSTLSRRHAGFTLIEAVVVIVISGIIAVMVAVFMRTPVEGYFDSVRRAELTDAADTALRRVARDVRAALPNSLRTGTGPSSSICFEFLPMVAGGRYRAEVGTGGGPFDFLDFTGVDPRDAAPNSFDVHSVVGLPQVGNLVVIYNLGIAGATAYDGSNSAAITAASTTSIANAPKLFPFESPSKRFQVIENNAVVFSCVGAAGVNAAGDGNITLFRTTRAIAAAMGACPTSGTVLVSNVSACSMSYNSAVTQRNGVLSLTLELARSNERAQLYQEVHVDNSP